MLDFIIVGAGICGCNLAFHLKDKKILIIDNAQKDCSSLVAAGVLNPITGKRLVKSWRSEVAMPYANKFYPELEKVLHTKFFNSSKILQLCKSEEERTLWQKRKEDSDYSFFLKGESAPQTFESLNDEFGSFFIESVAWIGTKEICLSYKKFFEEKNIYRAEIFDFSKLEIFENHISYKDISAKNIIFCEGYKAIENPYFNWLPFSPAKGEILEIQAQISLPNWIIHKEKWLMKLTENSFRCGSTWDRENFNCTPTESAKTEILKALPRIIKNSSELKVISQNAGVRPCTRTTRPFLGTHPTHKTLHIFNGFGSKGYALSPHFANIFVSYLLQNAPIDPEANISRHIKKFFTTR